MVKQTATAQVRAKEQEAEFQKKQQQLQVCSYRYVTSHDVQMFYVCILALYLHVVFVHKEALSNLSNMERVLKDEKEQSQKQCSDYQCQIAELQVQLHSVQ